MRKRIGIFLSALLLIGLPALVWVLPALNPAATAAVAAAAAPPAPFSVYPPDIQLDGAQARQAVIVQSVQSDFVTHDLTPRAKITVSNPSLARVDGTTLYPLSDGSCQATVTVDGKSVSVPLVVHNAHQQRPVSFKLDVMPVFMKAGCNTGACHGAASGKDGFHLSLFGFDPDGDYQRITRQQTTRRINLAIPKDSLLVQKALGLVPHTGGKRFDATSPMYQTLIDWLDAGAPADAPTVATPVSLEVMPHQAVLEGAGSAQQLMVRAHYSDGSVRDVTDMAVYATSNDNSATVTDRGLITAASRGEAFVMVRYSLFTIGAQIIVIPKDPTFHFPDVPEYNYIDTLVDAKLKKMRMIPAPLCDDQTFIRRAYIDIIGQLPTVADRDKFLADTDPHKRDRVVDELLDRKEFVEMWVMKFAELLQIRSTSDQKVSYKSALLYFNWLQQQLENNVPMDQIVQRLIEANGGTFKIPSANYYEVETDTLKLSENTAQVFMGMRIQCAQCHNHPFDRWTMNDYYSFAAFFTQVGRKSGEDPRETIIFDRGNGEMRNPITQQVMAPKFLGGAVPDCTGKDRREVLAKWLASPDNPYFAKNLANIVWAQFLGKGIIDPVDDVRVSNPASNPELLEALGEHFQQYHYDFKRLVRDICTSRAYQSASQTNPTNALDDLNFSHALVRRMRAEVLLDSISEVTQTKDKFRGLPLGARAVQIADGRTSDYFLTTFGRATRESVCSCAVSMQPNLSQALDLLNGDALHQKITSGGVVNQLLNKQKLKPAQVIDQLYLRCLGRPPTAEESTKLLTMVAPDNPAQSLEDIFWALLNSNEFLFNH